MITPWATRTRSCGFAVKANILNALEHLGRTASTKNSKDRVSWGVWDKINRCFSYNSTQPDTKGHFYFLNHYKNDTTCQKTHSGGHSQGKTDRFRAVKSTSKGQSHKHTRECIQSHNHLTAPSLANRKDNDVNMNCSVI